MKKSLPTNKKKENIAPYIDELMGRLYDFVEEHEGKKDTTEELVALFLGSQEVSHIIGNDSKLSAHAKMAVISDFIREVASGKDFYAEIDKHVDVLKDLFKNQHAKFDELSTLYFDENDFSEYKRKIILGHFYEVMRKSAFKNLIVLLILAAIFLTLTAFGVYKIPNYMRESGILAADISVFWIICLRILLSVIFLRLSFKLVVIILYTFNEKIQKNVKNRNS